MSCNCTLNKYQLTSNEGLNHYTLTELMRLVNGLILDPSFSYAVSNLDELNEIFKFYPTKEETIRILQGETGITPQRQNLNDYNLDYAWLNYYTKEEVITFIVKGYVPEKPPQTYTFTINPVPASATVVINGIESDTVVVYKGEQVLWTVSENGYTTKMGVQDVEEDTTIEVSLEEYEEDDPSEDKPVYTVCVQTEPSDAYVFINGERENCFSGAEGTVFDYTVQAGGYVPQSGKITVNADKTVYVKLEVVPEPETPRYTLIINPVPASATVIIDGQVRNNITVESGTVVNYSVQAEGYFFQEGSYMVTENYVLDVELEALPNYAPNYYFTINPTPSDATVVINGNEQSTYETQEGSIIVWSVSKEGYITENGTYVMGDSDYTIDISLEEYIPKNYTLTIYPSPYDAVVTIDGEVRDSITVVEGTSVSYSVEKEGYVSQSETLIINNDMEIKVSLRELGMYTFTVNPYPSYATVLIDDEIRNTITVREGTVVTWVVRLTGYTSQAGTYKVDKDSSINVFIECLGEPQTVSTLSEYEDAGYVDGVIDFCSYDLTPYTGDLTYEGYVNEIKTQIPYLYNGLRHFEGDLISNGRNILSSTFVDMKNLKSVSSLGENGDVGYALKMFCGANNVEYVNVANFGGANLTSTTDMFYKAYKLHTVDGLDTWTGSPTYVHLDGMFADCYELSSDVLFPNWKPQILTARWMFQNCHKLERFKMNDVAVLMNKVVSDLNSTTRVALSAMFLNCTSLKSVEMNDWDVRECNDFTSMFYGCSSLTDVSSLATWNFGGGDLWSFFENCNSLVDVSFIRNWNGTNTNFYRAFRNCSSLQEVDLTSFTSTLFEGTFEGCSRLRSVRIQFSNTYYEGNNTYEMFKDCTSLTEVYCMGAPSLSSTSKTIDMFYGVETTGTLYYPAEYAQSYTNIINRIPSTWTAVAY